MLAFFRVRNLLVRPLGNTIYFMPSYCIEDEDLDLIDGAIEEVIADPQRLS